MKIDWTAIGRWYRPLGLRVNMKKTKFLVSAAGQDVLKDSGRFPCAVCRKGVGANSILCSSCDLWVHKKCSGITGRLSAVPEFVCPRCQGKARPIDCRAATAIPVNDCMLDVENEFCYLGDVLNASGGCTQAIIARSRTAWGKFRKLRPLQTSVTTVPWHSVQLCCAFSFASQQRDLGTYCD